MRGVDINNPMQNYWRNGNMDFFQRRTTATLTTGSSYIADRVLSSVGGTTSKSMTVAASSSNLPPSVFPSTNALMVTNNTAIASLASGDYLDPYSTSLEGQMIYHLNQGYITIGFWLWCTAAMTLPVTVRDSNNTKSYVTMINTSVGYGFYTAYVPLDQIAIPNTNAKGVQILIGTVTGSTYHTPTLDTWVSGTYASHASATNWAASTGIKFYLGQCQIRQGKVPYNVMKSTFSRHGGSIDRELLDCQRYYEKTFPVSVTPAKNTGSYVGCIWAISSGAANVPFGQNWHFAAAKRTDGALITTYSPNAATANWGTNAGTTPVVVINTPYSVDRVHITGGTNTNPSTIYGIHITADADY